MWGNYGTDNPFGPSPQARNELTPLRQVGFPAVTTAAYSASTDPQTGLAAGYAWARYELDAAGAVTTPPFNQWVGLSGFDILNRTDIPAGTVCWCEPSPSHTGWLLFPVLGSAGSGSGGGSSGSGAGSGEGCGAAVDPVAVTCAAGARTLTVNSLAVSLAGNAVTLEVCAATDYALGPCSPVTPEGTKLPVVTLVCPVPGFLGTYTADVALDFEANDVVLLDGADATLPDPDTGHGAGADWFFIKNINAASATVTPALGALIDGAPSATLGQWESITVVTDGTDWFTI
jgi:hypothetical protein